MKSVLGALGYLARESRPDLSGPVSILQSRFNKAQVSDIQETNGVVRLAKVHTSLALPVCALCLMEMPVVETPVRNEHKLGTLLKGMAAPVTLVSWRSHRVKRVVASASAAEATGLSEAIAQGDWLVPSGAR